MEKQIGRTLSILGIGAVVVVIIALCAMVAMMFGVSVPGLTD